MGRLSRGMGLADSSVALSTWRLVSSPFCTIFSSTGRVMPRAASWLAVWGPFSRAAAACSCRGPGLGFWGSRAARVYSVSVWRTSFFCSRGPSGVDTGWYWAP